MDIGHHRCNFDWGFLHRVCLPPLFFSDFPRHFCSPSSVLYLHTQSCPLITDTMIGLHLPETLCHFILPRAFCPRAEVQLRRAFRWIYMSSDVESFLGPALFDTLILVRCLMKVSIGFAKHVHFNLAPSATAVGSMSCCAYGNRTQD